MLRKFALVTIPFLAIALTLTADPKPADSNGFGKHVGRHGFSSYGNGYGHGKALTYGNRRGYGKGFGYSKGHGYGAGRGYGTGLGYGNRYGYGYGRHSRFGAHKYGYGRVPAYGNKHRSYGLHYGGYRHRPHYDWHGPSLIPHGNHYDFVPGHWDKHHGRHH